MTIDSVTKMWSRSNGSKGSDDGRKYTAEFAEAYQVVHSAGTTIIEIEEATGIPRLRDAYPGANAVYCTKVGPVERIGPIFSIVPVQYKGEAGSDDPDDNPLNKEPDIDYGTVTVTEAIDEDIDGNPFTNTNGEIVEGLADEVWDYQLSVKRNFASFDPYALRLYNRSYSSDVFYGWPAGTASIKSLRAKPIFSKDFPVYYQVSATIAFREPYNTVDAHAWWKRYRNEGLNERVGTQISFTPNQGAAAYAVVNSSGAISKIVVTNRGNSYLSAPTVNIGTDTGGTGATATATINNRGHVTGVTVNNGGSGYKSKLIPAVDGDKGPVTKPVLLAIDGTREHDAEAAVWIERPTKRPLPYNALGLL